MARTAGRERRCFGGAGEERSRFSPMRTSSDRREGNERRKLRAVATSASLTRPSFLSHAGVKSWHSRNQTAAGDGADDGYFNIP